MPNKFKFTQQELDDMVIGALNAQPTGNQPGSQTAKPNALQGLLAKGRLGKGKQ